MTTYLSAKCPVFVAPAMDLDMFSHPTTTKNIELLKLINNHIIEPTSGELASGLEGKGRMEEPENIVRYLEDFFTEKPFLGKKILITAGPTYEKIDPVRFVGNYSTGKMGFALAEACAKQGANVRLVAGPTHLKTIHPNIERVNVESAAEMYRAALNNFEGADGAILCAAVADFTAVNVQASKLKRENENLVLELKPTIDIAASLGKIKSEQQFLVGFALETNNEEYNAKEKMKRKNFDLIVLNSLNDEKSGFGYDTNKITIFDKSANKNSYDLKSKEHVAEDILKEILKLIN